MEIKKSIEEKYGVTSAFQKELLFWLMNTSLYDVTNSKISYELKESLSKINTATRHLEFNGIISYEKLGRLQLISVTKKGQDYAVEAGWKKKDKENPLLKIYCNGCNAEMKICVDEEFLYTCKYCKKMAQISFWDE